jgi:hypothetical protein
LGLELIKLEQKRLARGETLGVPGAIIQTCIFAVTNSDVILELIQYYEPDSPNAYCAPVNALGQVHVAFRVKDIEKKMEQMKVAVVKFASEHCETIGVGPLANWKCVCFKDRDDTNMKMIEETV